MSDDLHAKLDDLVKVVEKATKLDGMIKESNFDWSLLKQEKSLGFIWFLCSILLFLVVCAFLIWSNEVDEKAYRMSIVVGLLSAAWLCGAAHLKFKNTIITFIAAFISLSALLISTNIQSPKMC